MILVVFEVPLGEIVVVGRLGKLVVRSKRSQRLTWVERMTLTMQRLALALVSCVQVMVLELLDGVLRIRRCRKTHRSHVFRFHGYGTLAAQKLMTLHAENINTFEAGCLVFGCEANMRLLSGSCLIRVKSIENRLAVQFLRVLTPLESLLIQKITNSLSLCFGVDPSIYLLLGKVVLEKCFPVIYRGIRHQNVFIEGSLNHLIFIYQ